MEALQLISLKKYNMIFYQCLKCKKVWQQPIGICPECFSELEKVKTEKYKVIGSSKVSIASITHFEVPYFSLILEDELGNKWAHKSIKDCAIGEEIIFDKGDDNSVAVWRNKYNMTYSIEKIFTLLNLSLSENSKVVILPTLFSSNHTYFRDNTSPDFLNSFLAFLFEKKIKIENIKIMTQSFDEVPIEGMAQKSGLLDTCLKNKITPMDLEKLNFVKKGILEISEEVLNADIVFNLAMMKIGKSSATENIYRIIKKENFSSLKYLQSEEEIIDELRNNLTNIVTFGEAEFVQSQNKTIVSPGLIMGSKNFVNLDRVFNEITVTDKISDIQDIEIVGRDIKEIKFISN